MAAFASLEQTEEKLVRALEVATEVAQQLAHVDPSVDPNVEAFANLVTEVEQGMTQSFKNSPAERSYTADTYVQYRRFVLAAHNTKALMSHMQGLSALASTAQEYGFGALA
eukprot:CAMPEP_0205827548 /NCGR_PEP_ID=MMETSP0206-20130828/32401_1 /ASSEMBLY_ACC=CAM_ASM_000279 /TAXON_ID=36767 /ORGANISM="Euplotes focardii, Strain TN1" /LENGTH=110 /DNA_ID=CAMNT_0053128571 /DNA_START=38 /DNA_END=370 /DNA_ORIENTATION=+